MRDDDLLRIRPVLGVETDEAGAVETFQHRTLRPVLKLQNPAILRLVAAQVARYGIPFVGQAPAEQRAAVRRLLKDDGRLKHTLVGLVAGHFTEAELGFYLGHEGEVRRRLTTLLVERVEDQLGTVAELVAAVGG